MINRNFRSQGKFEQNGNNIDINLLATETSIYQHQVEALKAIVAHFSSPTPKIGVVVLPTGGGKSGIAAMIPYLLKCGKVLVITPSIIISEQLHADFCHHGNRETYYERVGLITHELSEGFCAVGRLVKTGYDSLSGLERYELVIANAQKFGNNSKIGTNSLNENYDLVIVDEAHHYPAETWKSITDKFSNKNQLLLTATPFNNNKPILNLPNNGIIYCEQKAVLVERGIIRPTEFVELGNENDGIELQAELMANKIIELLDAHDVLDNDPAHRHQAMILVHGIDCADECSQTINCLYGNIAASFHGTSNKSVFNKFNKGELRILVVCGRLIEGYDRKNVSVVGILRNVQESSRVLFTQFVGRCIRRFGLADQVTASVISHVNYAQSSNYANMDVLATVDPEDPRDIVEEI